MRRHTLAWTLTAGVVLAVLTWHVTTVQPGTGIDASWEIGLQLAARHGLDFGRDVIFTYGPLGFLSVPLVVSAPLGALGLVFALLAQVALAVAVYAAASRTYGRAAGFVLAFLALGLTLLVSDALVYLSLFAAVWVLERDEPPAGAWLVPLAGLAAAFELLVKLNGGIVCLVLLALAAWRLRPGGWRSELVLAASFAVSLLVLWSATGNSPAALPDWLRESWHVVGSYTDAMALEPSGRTAETVIAGLLVVASAALLALHVRPLPRARGVALVLVGAVFVYAYLKEGLVRHDAHVLDLFGALGVAALAFAWRGALRWVAVALVLGAAVGALATPEISLGRLYRPDLSVRRAAAELRDVVTHDVRSQADVRARLGVPGSDLALLRGHTVDAVPYETSAVWAYGLRWRPEPLLQWYMAYDAHLDAANAAAVARRGAERVLRQRVPASDGKAPELEAPATYLALLCNYRELAADGSWEVLGRVPDRCGAPRTLETLRASAGETIPVPRAGADEVVVAHVRVPRPLGSRLLSTLAKPFTLPQILLDGNAYRLVTETASGPLVLRLPAAGGRSPFFGGYASHDSFSLRHVASPFTVEFDAVPIRPQQAGFAQRAAPSGTLEGGAPVVLGRRFRVDPSAFQGWVDVAQPAGAVGALAGWAVDPATKRPAPLVAAFAGGRLVGLVRPSETREDVAQALRSQAAARSGYSLVFPLPRAADVRVFALGAGRATELSYPPGYPWGR